MKEGDHSTANCHPEGTTSFPSRQRSSSSGEPSCFPNKTLFALVGLPARGKSFIASKIVSFFQWSGTEARIFNAGTKRRKLEGAVKSGRSEFFNNQNEKAVSKRDEIALATLNEAIDWLLRDGGSIALFDATNTTRARRELIRSRLQKKSTHIELVFIESICTDEEVLQNNLLQKIRHSPDFQGIPEEEALSDLKKRILAYERVYEPVSDDENVAYIKVIDFANKVVCYQVFGAVQLRCVQLLMSSHVGNRPVYLVRSGNCADVDDMNRNLNGELPTKVASSGPEGYISESPNNATPSNGHFALPISAANVKIPSSLTCNSHLSAEGQRFGRRLHKFFVDQEKTVNKGVSAVPFTSNTPRAIETASYLPNPPLSHQQWSALNILNTGICHGLSVQTIREEMPEEFSKWKEDPFSYRFPGGESILDMNKRLSDIVLEIERLQAPTIVVSHLSTIQSLIAYFTGIDRKQIPFVPVPQHSVIILTPNIYGWTQKTITEDDLPEST